MKPIVAGLTVAKLTADDQALLKLLRAAGLPTSDLQTGVQKRFIGLHDGSVLVAAGGLELHGRYGLLRSLVVAESHRGSGKGKYISERLISEARALGLEALYLLTTTAERFFQRIGFERIRRESVPTPVQQTAEFNELCPKSAIVMRYKL
jgi:amino-acid N-acetyltransferase